MSSYPVAFFYLAAIPSPSRSSSRASRVVERLASCHPVPSRASHRMKGKQARRRGWAVSVLFRCSVPSSVRGVSSPVPVVFSVWSSSPRPHHPRQASKATRGNEDKGMNGWHERRRHGGLNVSPARISAGNENKQTRQERQAAPPHSYHLTIPRAPSHLMPNNQPPRPTTSTHETEERDAQARERRANTGDDERSERRSENARASQDDDKHETTNETHNETTTTRKKQTNRGAKVGGREEQTATFSHLSPDPLSPILSRPSASIIPPPPGVG